MRRYRADYIRRPISLFRMEVEAMNWLSWLRKHRSLWICRIGAPAVTVAEILTVGGLVMGLVAFLVWLSSGPALPAPTRADYRVLGIFTVHAPSWGAALDFVVGTVALGVIVVAIAGPLLYAIVMWHYRKCHDYWYPEEKGEREVENLIEALCPELDWSDE